MRKITPTELRRDLFKLLDEVLQTGEGLEIERAGGRVLLLAQPNRKLDRLSARPTVQGDSDDLDEIHWDGAWQPGFT